MTSLINKIEQLIKREKTTPEKKLKDDSKKSSSEILSELFGAFNAAPPKIEEPPVKKSKKSKKKHKKEKKKRSRSSSSCDSDDSEYLRKRKKRKKSKSKKKRDRSRSPTRSPPPKIKSENNKTKNESKTIKSEEKKEKIKVEAKEEQKKSVSIKVEDQNNYNNIDTSLIPMPESPTQRKLDADDLRLKLDSRKDSAESDKAKSKIQIKNLKFSAVFEETVKKAEEEARKKAEKHEEGEYTDSSSSSESVEVSNSHFPKSSDLGGILKKPETESNKISENGKSSPRKSKTSENSNKTSKRDGSRSRKRSSSRSKRSRSSSASRRRRHRSSSRTRRRSRSKHRSVSRTRRRSRSRSRIRHRHISPRHRSRRPSRSSSRVKLADSEKKRLLEVARRNAINMLKNGAVPAGAAALPPHTRTQVMAAIHSGGKSVDELTDFCKHLSKKEALGELSSVSSHDGEMSENEDTLAFHHPFLVKEKAPIVMNIRGGAPLPIKPSSLTVANKDELRLQFPVSSGSQHREKASEWVPVSPKKDNMQVAKLNATKPKVPTGSITEKSALALPAPPDPPPYMKSFTGGAKLTSVPPMPAPPEFPALPALAAPPALTAPPALAAPPALPALPAPGPQAYPPGVEPPNIDLALIVSQKLSMIRKEQEQNEISHSHGFGWSKDVTSLGQFTGSTGAQILTPRELASGTQAWAKKDQLVRAAPVEGGMGMHLLQKMGWTPGRGLGKEGTGALQPLLLEVKLDTRGLQAKEEGGGRSNKGIKQNRPGRRGPAAPLVAGGKHPVSLLGEYCSKQKLGPPEYNLCFECGPDHKKNFLFKVKVAGVEYQPAVASANKKQAKFDAAQLALQKLGIAI